MELSNKQKEEVKKLINESIEKTFGSALFLKNVKKNIFKALTEEVTVKSKENHEDVLVKKYIKIAKPTDEQWMDLTAAAAQSLLVSHFPELHRKISTMKLGRALSEAGAIKGMKNGINVYRIAKVKTPKEK